MSPTDLAETAAISLQNALDPLRFSILTRRDLRNYWHGALNDAGFLNVPWEYTELTEYAEQMAGLRKSVTV